MDKKRLTRTAQSALTLLMIDGKVQAPKVNKELEDLPERPPGIKRPGGQTVWEQEGIRITMALEAIQSKSKAGATLSRRLDTLLVKYRIENLSKAVRKVGCRTAIDTNIGNNDGPHFASPASHPNIVLNRYVFRNQDVPEFIEVLERPSWHYPGFKGIFTFKLDKRWERPGKVVLTSSDQVRRDQWEVRTKGSRPLSVRPFWELRDLQPGAKRELAFAYGQGIAATVEGRVSADFRGPFVSGQPFTIMANVDDPLMGQHLTLQLPQGIELMGSKTTQIVRPASETGASVVLWRCRLLQVGTHLVGIRSNTGVTQFWKITVS